MESILGFFGYVVPFLVVLTVLVFVHELGHYLVARWNGVRVEVFSIGFGPELIGWHDKHRTRWKIAAIPFGGYVKFFGDESAASDADTDALAAMDEAQRGYSFHHKTLAQRAAIVVAGPMANFIYAIVVLAVLFMVFGQRFTPPEIGRVIADSAGEQAGFRAGDVVLAVDGDDIDRFEELQQAIVMNPERPLSFKVRRGGDVLTIDAVPRGVERDDIDGIKRPFGELGLIPSNPAVVGTVYPQSPAEGAGFRRGDRIIAMDGRIVDNFETLQDIVAASQGRMLAVEVERAGETLTLRVAPRKDVLRADGKVVAERWLIGIQRDAREPIRLGPGASLWAAVTTSYDMIGQTLEYVGQMISGSRGTEDLGGPLRIAHASGQAAQVGIEQLIFLSVLLSLNLGLINLFPIPVLDGGHLMLYGLEAIRGRPLTERMQEYAFRFGLVFVLSLTVFATWNDLVNLRVVEFITGLFS
jgi:regulator of sigma E protease